MNQSFSLQPRPRDTTIGLVLLGCLLLYLILQGGLTWLAPRLDQTGSQLLVATIMLLVALLLERLFWGRQPAAALRVLGLGQASQRAIGVALLMSALMQLFFPAFAWLTGASVRLKPDWWWIVIGAVALNGIAEETLFRAFVFGHLRREGQGMTFRRAALISLLIFAAVHFVLFVQNPFIIGVLGTLIAVTAAFPLAYLFEQGGFSIWPTVLLHVATHSIRFVQIDEPFYMTAVLAWLILQVGAPFLLFAFQRTLLKKESKESA
jgi:membrane protease YdiL (CAAX protease family)